MLDFQIETLERKIYNLERMIAYWTNFTVTAQKLSEEFDNDNIDYQSELDKMPKRWVHKRAEIEAKIARTETNARHWQHSVIEFNQTVEQLTQELNKAKEAKQLLEQKRLEQKRLEQNTVNCQSLSWEDCTELILFFNIFCRDHLRQSLINQSNSNFPYYLYFKQNKDGSFSWQLSVSCLDSDGFCFKLPELLTENPTDNWYVSTEYNQLSKQFDSMFN